jgi:hypothetical protein
MIPVHWSQVLLANTHPLELTFRACRPSASPKEPAAFRE